LTPQRPLHGRRSHGDHRSGEHDRARLQPGVRLPSDPERVSDCDPLEQLGDELHQPGPADGLDDGRIRPDGLRWSWNELRHKGYLSNTFTTNELVWGWVSSATGLNVGFFNAATLALAGGGGVYDAAATAAGNLTGNRVGATGATVYYTVKGATFGYDNSIKVSTAVGAGSSVVVRSLALASRVSTAGPMAVFLAKYTGNGQATYFLINPTNGAYEIARAMPDVAAPDSSNSLLGLLALPNLMTTVNTSTWLTSGLRAAGVISLTAGVSTFVSASTITVVHEDITLGKPVVLNGVLHIPGATPLMYDGGPVGQTIVEDGFPIAPEQSDAYVIWQLARGALTPSSTYTYRYVYEWTDATGALHQSAPNL
jgi:hypothetical protein